MFEVADIVRSLGASLRQELCRDQHRAVSAIEACRTAVLGGHVSRCEDCAHIDVAYNSCRNRHCPKCQAAAAHDWLEARRRDLLPVAYFHVVFTLPAPVADLAFANKAAVYDALFKATTETLLTIGADPRHLGARLGATLVLHTWGSAMTHHPHIHGVVPAGGLSPDGERWIDCRKRFFLPVRVLSRLFRRLMCERLEALHAGGQLQFFGKTAPLADPGAFAAFLDEQRRRDWVVYARRPFAGPEQVLAYLARYTHRIAISNSRITGFDGERVTFRVKDYRKSGAARYGLMTLSAAEFMRRFLSHVLPDGFHRIRHIGFLANTRRKAAIARARELLADRMSAPVSKPEIAEPAADAAAQPAPCPCCGGRIAWCWPRSSSGPPGRRRAASSLPRESTAHDPKRCSHDDPQPIPPPRLPARPGALVWNLHRQGAGHRSQPTLCIDVPDGTRYGGAKITRRSRRDLAAAGVSASIPIAPNVVRGSGLLHSTTPAQRSVRRHAMAGVVERYRFSAGCLNEINDGCWAESGHWLTRKTRPVQFPNAYHRPAQPHHTLDRSHRMRERQAGAHALRGSS
jgi:hypothetical protein